MVRFVGGKLIRLSPAEKFPATYHTPWPWSICGVPNIGTADYNPAGPTSNLCRRRHQENISNEPSAPAMSTKLVGSGV